MHGIDADYLPETRRARGLFPAAREGEAGGLVLTHGTAGRCPSHMNSDARFGAESRPVGHITEMAHAGRT